MAWEKLFKTTGEGFSGLKVSDERIAQVLKLISDGSEPHMGYYALISAATVIASLGLVQNSGPVVIGAMLVSPLMMPIYGLSAGMVRGDTGLFFRGLKAEIGGVALAVLFGMIFGALPLMTDLTPEIMARLEPNLLDLLVAVFAGLAGTWAVVDERISPVLPGVAISTAIIPPLAVAGICLSRGAFSGAQGAFLLFLANLLAILLVSALVFWRAGLGTKTDQPKETRFLPEIAVTVILLLLVGGLLTRTLVRVMDRQNRTAVIGQVLRESEGTHPIFSIRSLKHRRSGNDVYVLVDINTSKTLSPSQVARWEKKMSRILEAQVKLTVNCNISQEVSSVNTSDVAARVGLNGINLEVPVHQDVRLVRIAEQTIRQAFKDVPDVSIQEIDLVHLGARALIVASIQSHRLIRPSEIGLIEDAIRRAAGEEEAVLVIRNQRPYDLTRNGRIILGEMQLAPHTDKERKLLRIIKESVRGLGNMYVKNVDGIRRDDYWEIYAEILGDRLVRPEEVKELERKISNEMKEQIKIRAWTRAELIATDERYRIGEAFMDEQKTKSIHGRIEKNLRELLKQEP
ncbi:TIGR00341 family protein [Thermodesulfobacteriota bacterium]